MLRQEYRDEGLDVWMEIGEVIKAVAPAITAITAVVGAVVGIRALNKWQAETIGRRRIELAEDVLADFYDARDRMIIIRSPSYVSEGDARKPLPNESERETRDRDMAHAPLARYERHREFFYALNAKRYRLRAMLGSGADAPFNDLLSAINEVRNTAQMLMEHAGRESRNDIEQITVWRSALFGIGEDDNKISRRIDHAVAAMEELCQPLLESAAADVVGRRKWHTATARRCAASSVRSTRCTTS